MGIKNFHTFLKKKIPNVYQTKEIKEIYGKKLAIDTSIFMCRFKNIYGESWLDGFYQLITLLLKNNIDIIFVFDSKPPPEKDEEREQRSLSRKKNKDRIEKILKDWELLLDKKKEDSIFTMEECKEYESLYQFLEKKTSNQELSKDTIISLLIKLQKNLISIKTEDFILLRELFTIMNISFYEADSEAEGTCSLMARKGLVDGVLTEDTDVIAYGSPYMYFGINLGNETIQELSLENILQELKVNFENLQDFCILCGTDYNQNMKKIGPVKSFDLIQKYGSLENLPHEYDTTILNFNRVRKLFECDQYNLKIESFNSKESINIDSLKLQEFCFYHNISFKRKEGTFLLQS